MTRPEIFIFLAAITALAAFAVPQAAAESSGSIAVSLSYPNGDIADYSGSSLKIYQDSSSVPYRLIDSITGNPFNIVSLPIGHKYKIETYVNGLHSSDTYVDLQGPHVDAEIKLPLPGGMRLDVYYDDGVTPIPNAEVSVISADNRTWVQGNTNSNGQTLRFWLEPTVFQFDHYTANVKIGSNLSYSQSPVFLQPGTSQEIKVVTKWPSVVNSLITVRVVGPDQKPVTASNFTVYAADGEGNTISQSKISRGEAYFSNLKVGDYEFKAVKADGTVLGTAYETIDGSRTDFALYANAGIVPQPASNPTPITPHPPTASCGCVIFRVDGVQDYWLDNVQTDVIDTFYQKGAKQTVGIVANAFGNDTKLVKHIASESDKIEYAINGWNFEDFTMLDRDGQAKLLEQSRQKIWSLVGVSPNVFIPPFGRADNATFYALSGSPITFLSAAPNFLPPTTLDGKIHLLPTSLILDSHAIQYNASGDILASIQDKIKTNGVAVVALNFQDFARDNGTDKINISNETRLQKLGNIIDDIRNSGISITTAEEAFNGTSIPVYIPPWMKDTAGWWSEGYVSDQDFVSEINYLVQEGIIKMPQPAATSPFAQADKIKGVAADWSKSQVPDEEFVPALQHLISTPAQSH
ncbi:MAG TPA: polysaccharide deacetylase family protein [Candidatus Nitrosotalea sp.]|nr:polysaccharide deacetylase family protein [Candidatus Nitrosotalea sp.]